MASTPDARRGLVTRILHAVHRGEATPADELLPLVYDELRKIAGHRMASLAPGQTLQATALVHEAYLRLVGDDDPGWEGRAHFFGAAAEAMRQILIERARRKASLKHGGHLRRIDAQAVAELAAEEDKVDALLLDGALIRLERANPRKAELVKLRFFGGLSVPEVAKILGVSVATAERDWSFAKAWLRSELPVDNE